jgi:hypothetical protein
MLYVHFNEYTPAVVDDLSMIADDPAFQINLWTAGGPGTGEATFLEAPQITPGSNLLLALMASPTGGRTIGAGENVSEALRNSPGD